jgi:glutathione peroxidase
MPMSTLSDFCATTLEGQEQDLYAYAGQVALVVNTASECGFTPQLEGLEALHRQYADQGLVVLGFPCNQFGGQEPGTEAEIGAFCQRNYGVTFAMFAKVDVNGDDAHPLFEWLKTERGGLLGSAIKWNFTKFLVGRDGEVVKRYGSTTKPEDLAADVEAALAAPLIAPNPPVSGRRAP